MKVGVVAEIKDAERRVGMTPSSVREVVSHGHEVTVQTGAGRGISASDDDYIAAGARIGSDAAEVWGWANMIVKVKEPQAVERAMLRPDHVLFTYLHLAPDFPQTDELIKSGATCIAYETVTDAAGGLPLLAPMSQVAGRMSIQAGAMALEAPHGGAGLLLGGVPGVSPAKVVVIGGGVVGENAVQMAIGLGADVTVLDNNVRTLERLANRFGASIRTLYSTRQAAEDCVRDADLVVGAVLVKGDRAPKLVSAETVAAMRAGSAMVDVAIDQGGCFETSHATTHSNPTYLVNDVVHYCVANMPGAVPKTSTYALNNATLPFIVALADKGARGALLANPHLLSGLSVCGGKVTDQQVADCHNITYVPATEALVAP
jgi:alanine dehydrogenase